MSDWTQADPTACPDDDDLLLASEGELPVRRLEAVREHVRRCADCRARLAREGAIVGAYLWLTASEAAAGLTERSPAEADRFRETLQREVARKRPPRGGPLTRMAPRHWLSVAAAVPLLVIGLIFSSRYTQAVKADELLTKAVQEEQRAPVARMRRLQIRIVSAASPDAPVLVREIGAGTMKNASSGSSARATPSASTMAAQAREEARLAARLAAHHFDLDDPLSVGNFQAWRASLPSKRDRVDERREARLVALTTTTDDGALRRAELVVRQSDHHPIQQTLSFDDGEDVVTEEMAAWVVEAPPLTPAIVPPPSKVTGREAARGDLAPPAARRAEVEAPLAYGLAGWRARTFSGGPGADTFGPQMVQLLDGLRSRARRLIALPAGQAAAARSRDYAAFVTTLQAVDDKLALFLGTSTRGALSSVPPIDLDSRAAAIAARVDTLRAAVRLLLVQEDVPMPGEIGVSGVEPPVLAAVRRALDDLWAAVHTAE